MDQISIAIEKARKLRQERVRSQSEPAHATVTVSPAFVREQPASEKTAKPQVRLLALDEARLEDSRLVSHPRHHASHVAFDMLRTKISHAMTSHGWSSVAVTSPTPGCGKSVVAFNLAFSMAHQPGKTVVLVDLDLRSPRLAEMVGYTPTHGFADYLNGHVELTDLCVRATENLVLCLNNTAVSRSAEWMRHEKLSKLPALLKDRLGADLIIFDLPPALTTDDVMVFCPYVDCVMLVAGAGQTTAREIEEAERQLTLSNYLGVVLNKALGSDIRPYSHNPYGRK
jgi:Mrp family chromosome partitioning ATPase